MINQPKNKVAELLKTLSNENDGIWPKEKWPTMKFKGGIKIGAKGGHGPIRYSVEKYEPKKIIQFRFSKPEGFNGIHKFEISALNENQTEIRHTIDMQTVGKGTIKWIVAVRSLHDALIEDAFDKIENNYTSRKKSTDWSLWVKMFRKILS